MEATYISVLFKELVPTKYIQDIIGLKMFV